MKKIIVIAFTIFLTLLQVTFTHHICFGWYNYGLMLTAIIVLTSFDYVLGYIGAAVCGFFMDCLLGGVDFVYLIISLASALAVHLATKYAFRQTLLTVLIFTFVLTFATELVQYWIFIVGEQTGAVAYALTKLIFPQAFINTFCAVFVYVLYAWLFRKLNYDKGGLGR
ncbi:MAG: hypothetical protein IJE10_08020 [Clostridia bacterium]|nr:hypothetical protein [Clostridia bacterium]